MANPTWFDATAYFYNKLELLGEGWDALTLKTAFENAGYLGEEGLYQHFLDYGAHEGASPSALFDNAQYMYSKSVAYYGTAQVSPEQSTSISVAFEQAGVSAWEHYVLWGAFEKDAAGYYTNNPSVDFNTNQYMLDKLAHWNYETGEVHTLQELEDALREAGLTPLEHYLLYGQAEGLTAKTAPTGENFSVGDEPLYGTAGNDYFIAREGMLDSLNYIDGFGGTDMLYATLVASAYSTAPIAPEIRNVEKIVFRVQSSSSSGRLEGSEGGPGDWGDNNPSFKGATVDAGDIYGMTYLKNDNSRADLVVEDVRTNSTDMIIAWADSDPGDVDFAVFFDPQHLKDNGASVSGTLQLQIMDVLGADTVDQPLLNQPFDQFRFAYVKADGSYEILELQFRAEDVALYSGADADYNTLLQAFQNALDDLVASRPEYAGVFELSLGASFTSDATVNNIEYHGVGTSVQLSSTLGTVSADNDEFGLEVGWATSTGVVPSQGRIVWDVLASESQDCPLIQTTVHLDNVGRVQWNDATGCLPSNDDYGSEAGDLIIGSMATRGGVERFDVLVDRGSWLNSLSSTNNTLRMVTVANADINEDGVNGNLAAQANGVDGQKGQLYIGASMEPGGGNLVAWQDAPNLLATNGLVDVKYFEAGEMADDGLGGSKAAFEGDLNIGASITSNAYQKYLEDVDGLNTVYSQYAPSGEFLYNLGKGDDTINMTVDSGIAADRDFKLLINGNDGDDFINFQFTGPLSDNQIVAMARNTMDNGGTAGTVWLNGGAGDDLIKFWGDGSVRVTGGEGDDVLYVGQLQDNAPSGSELNAVWVLNAYDRHDRAIYVTPEYGAQPLFNNIGSSLASVGFTGTAGETLYVTVTFKGFEATVAVTDFYGQAVTVSADGSGSVGADAINKAIINAIVNDPVLSSVLYAGDGAGYSLIVQSLIDGEMDVNDLSISFHTLENAVDTTPSAVTGGLVDAYASGFATFGQGDAYITPVDAVSDFVDGRAGAPATFVYTTGLQGVDLDVGTVVAMTYDGVIYTATTTAELTTYAELAELLMSADDGSGNLLGDLWAIEEGTAGGTLQFTFHDDTEFLTPLVADDLLMQLTMVDDVENFVDGDGIDPATFGYDTGLGEPNMISGDTLVLTFQNVAYTITLSDDITTNDELAALLMEAVDSNNNRLGDQWIIADASGGIDNGVLAFMAVDPDPLGSDITNDDIDTALIPADMVADFENGVAGLQATLTYDTGLGAPNLDPGTEVFFEYDGVTYTVFWGAPVTTDAELAAMLSTARDASGNSLGDLWTIANTDGQDDGILQFTYYDQTEFGADVPTADDFAMSYLPAGAQPALDVDGTDTGTTSASWVNGGAGDDVIVLNAAADKGDQIEAHDPTALMVRDVLVVDDEFGNDSIFNFNNTGHGANMDKIDLGAFGATVDSGSLVAGVVATPDGGWTDVTLLNYLNSADANHAWDATGVQGAGFVQVDDYTYLFFSVNNAATDGLQTGEVHILGTMTFDTETVQLTGADLVGSGTVL